MKKYTASIWILSVFAFLLSFGFSHVVAKENSSSKKIGILLVNHGSRSATWRAALTTLEDRVHPALMKSGDIQGIKTAFMEYTEPSIATRMKEFDAEGFTDVIIVPIFLTISSHTFDDIPTILGKKTDPHSMETLKIEKIERYSPKTNTFITPNLDFTDMLKKNVLRRVKALSKNPKDEALVMIAYGDATYEKEWSDLLSTVGQYVKQNIGITEYTHGWCGHVAHYNPEKTTEAIEQALEKKKSAVVIPILVAHDEMFQIKIIGDGIAAVKNNKDRVIYKPDSILPDDNVEHWVIDAANDYVSKIKSGDLVSN